MTVDVRGVDFPPEEPAALTLNGAGRTLDLGSVTPDVEGVFTYVFAVPADLPEGSYVLSAAVSDHTVFSPPFTVSGQPVTGEEGGERRGQEEPILAPLPDVPQATPVPSLETDRATQDLAPRVNTATTAAAGVIIISLVFIVLGSMWMRRSR
jgi:hypothetical protein